MVNISYTVITWDAWKAVIRVSIYLALGDSITAGILDHNHDWFQ